MHFTRSRLGCRRSYESCRLARQVRIAQGDTSQNDTGYRAGTVEARLTVILNERSRKLYVY